MSPLRRAKKPFIFNTRLHLSELTGLKASNLRELLAYIKKVSGSCIYYHTHRFLQIHQYLSPEPPNDFAYWVTNALREDALAEQLASIDIIQFNTIRELRQEIITIIEKYMQQQPLCKNKFASPGSEFHFIKAASFVLPTPHAVYTLQEFVDVLKDITIDSLYFHIFEARLRLRRKSNDFSYWIEDSLGDKELANTIAHIDPYTRTMDDLRKSIIVLIEKRIASPE
jgi:hypothetical protein